jgi:hypothetical protein
MSLLNAGLKTGLVACGVALASVSAALAQGQALGQVYVVDRSGEVSTVQMNEKGHAMIMQHAHRLPAGTIVYISGGHIYMMKSRGMAAHLTSKTTCCE